MNFPCFIAESFLETKQLRNLQTTYCQSSGKLCLVQLIQDPQIILFI